tara:strand:- start:209 stop:1060 length:852 start_codon:yes stop_codon:yes gene_type:complete
MPLPLVAVAAAKIGAKLIAKKALAVGVKAAAKKGAAAVVKKGAGAVAKKAAGKTAGKLSGKIAKGFSKAEKLTGGKLGNAAELKQKAGNQLKQTAMQGGQKIAGNRQERIDQKDGDANAAIAAAVENAKSSGGSGGGGGYSNPSGVSMHGASNYVVSPGGSTPKQVMRQPGAPQKNSLDPANLITQENRQFLPEELDVKGFSIPVAGIARVTGAMIKTKKENKLKKLDKKNLKETAVINSNKMLRQRSSTANQENKFAEIAKNVSKRSSRDIFTKGIKPSYKK